MEKRNKNSFASWLLLHVNLTEVEEKKPLKKKKNLSASSPISLSEMVSPNSLWPTGHFYRNRVASRGTSAVVEAACACTCGPFRQQDHRTPALAAFHGDCGWSQRPQRLCGSRSTQLLFWGGGGGCWGLFVKWGEGEGLRSPSPTSISDCNVCLVTFFGL